MKRTARCRRGFTLLEMVFAVTIGTMVMVTAGSLLIGMLRNERAIARRAEDTAALMRIRQVMQKSFSTVLMAPTPSGRAAPTAVAAPVATPAAGGAAEAGGQAGGQNASGAGALNAAAQNLADRQRSSRILDEARASTPPRIVLERGLGPAPGGGAGFEGGFEGGFEAGGAARGVVPTMRAEMSASSVLGIGRGVPQRLELVLIDPPVPTQAKDVFEVARAVRKVSQERLARRELAKQTGEDTTARAVPVDETSDTSEGQGEEELVGVRAVRGAFELRPQERAPSDDEDAPQLFELWWVPSRLLRSVEEMREQSRAARVVEAASVGDPFRIAQHIKSMRWRMFDDAVLSEAYVGVFRQDLPGYVELDIEMASGVVAQWLFEVGLQTGNEASPPRPETTARGAGNSGTSGEPASGTGSSGTGSSGGSSTVPATPMQPSRTRGGR